MLSIVVDRFMHIMWYTFVPGGSCEEIEPIPDGLREIKTQNDSLGELLINNRTKKAIAILDENDELVGIEFESIE